MYVCSRQWRLPSSDFHGIIAGAAAQALRGACSCTEQNPSTAESDNHRIGWDKIGWDGIEYAHKFPKASTKEAAWNTCNICNS